MTKKEISISIIILLIIVSTILLSSCSFIGYFEKEKFPREKILQYNQSVRIANWNLKVFGPKKASNSQLMQTYADIIDNFDIIFIQEIRDKNNIAFPKLCDLLKEYNCINSSRAGTTNIKEQYGIIYKKKIELLDLKDFNTHPQNKWERPPIKTTFKIGKNYTLKIYNLHTKPTRTDVKFELVALESIVEKNGNIIIIGDLNADCTYYNAAKEKDFHSWNWIIKDDDDTTVSKSNCAYDRIIINDNAYAEYDNYGIFKQGINKEISDHYLIWIKIR